MASFTPRSEDNGVIAQLVHGRFNITSPVALFQDVVFVIVECRHLSGHSADVFAEECYDAQNPDWASIRSIHGLSSSFLIRSLNAVD